MSAEIETFTINLVKNFDKINGNRFIGKDVAIVTVLSYINTRF